MSKLIPNSILMLLRLAWGHAWRRPLQSLFLIFGVAIGVAMIVAIDLANGSAERAFQLGTESVAGRSTHQIVGGPNGVDEQVYTDLRRNLGFRTSAPVVESYVTATELDEQPMRLFGIDPFSESPFRSYLGVEGSGTPAYLNAFMVQPGTVLLGSHVAERYGLSVGDSLSILLGSQADSLEIVGLLEPTDALSRRALDGLLIVDISTAQEILGSVGTLDRIDLIVSMDARGEADLAEIAAMLPPSARIERAAARDGTVNEMTNAFGLNLTALSLLALVVGMFLIYNTVTFSVVQRRPVLGSLRSMGMTRREIFGLILAEAGVLGIIGTAAGLFLGILLGRGAVQLVTQTINDLFFVVSVREVDIPLWTLVKGTGIGISAALIGAVVPAYEATSVPPAGAFKRSNVEERIRSILPILTIVGVLFLFLAAYLLIPEWNLVIAFAGLFAVILGCALLTPVLTLALMAPARWFANRQSGLIGRMAPRTITRSLSRTSVAIAALMVAVSVIIGVGIMINSFRSTVATWLEDVLQADIFIAPPSLISNQVTTSITPELIERIEAVPGVIRTATTRGVNVVAFLDSQTPSAIETEGNGAGAGNIIIEDGTKLSLIAFNEDIAGEKRRYREAIGDWQETWQAMLDGGIVINEPMANRTKLGVGDEITIQTDLGRKVFTIVGVAINFEVQSVVYMNDAIYRQFWNDDKLSAVGLFIGPEASLDEVADKIRETFAGDVALVVRSNRDMRQNALDIFDRTFSITVALQLLATLVAFIGILSTLMSLQLERQREIGVLRASGMTRGQLWRLSMLETGLIGSAAGIVAMPTGLLLALILIYIINLRSFGWTLEMQLQPQYFLQALAVSLVAALLAGIYPAWRMGRTQPATALRAE